MDETGGPGENNRQTPTLSGCVEMRAATFAFVNSLSDYEKMHIFNCGCMFILVLKTIGAMMKLEFVKENTSYLGKDMRFP